MKAAVASFRLGAQRLVGAQLQSPAAVVGHLGAVQSQMHDMALWAIGRRCGATLADTQAAFARGDFLRTHVLRPTWHDVLPSDLGDLLEVTGPRIRQLMVSGNKILGLTSVQIDRAADIACEAVKQSDEPLTRAEIDVILTDAGYPRFENSLGHILIHAELSGRIASGPMRGKQHTYIAVSLPTSRRSPDERLAWLAETYGRGHGPFRAKDLAWWTSLTLTQARRAIELAGLKEVELAGEAHFLVEPLEDVEVPRAMLLPAFDEYISYARDADDFSLVGGEVGMVMRTTGLLFVDGALSGSWTRAIRAGHVDIEVAPTRPVARPVSAAIEAEAERFGAFVNRPATCVVHALR